MRRAVGGARVRSDVPALARPREERDLEAASAPIAAISRNSDSPSSIAPEPCETRLTTISCSSALRTTSSSTRAPSTLGISTRKDAPSGKRFALAGGSALGANCMRPSAPSALMRPHPS